VAPGEAKNTYGTGAFMLMNTGAKRPSLGDGLLTTIACDANGGPCYALEAAIFIAGAAVQWIRDGLGLIATASETEALASGLSSNDGVYFVPALTGLGAPHWEAEARGTLVGLTRGTTRAHIVRAALEAMAFGTADVMQSMQARSGVTLDALRVDGGAANNGWLMQFQADVLGVPVEKPAMVETTALGAAGLAGLHTGVWSSATEFRSAQRISVVTPGTGAADARAAYVGWHRAVRAALSWARDV
jgi:glycerol kinase